MMLYTFLSEIETILRDWNRERSLPETRVWVNSLSRSVRVWNRRENHMLFSEIGSGFKEAIAKHQNVSSRHWRFRSWNSAARLCANGRNIVGQQLPILWMLHLGSIFTLCCMLLRVVGSCCAKFETGKTLSPAQTDVTLFGVHVASVCT